MPRARLSARLLLLAGATVFALLGGEFAFRVLARKAPGPPKFLTQSGEEVPVYEIAHYLRRSGEIDRALPHPRGTLQAGLHMKQGYDHPRWAYFDAQGCVPIDHDSLGFRDLEFPVHKRPGEFRVLALGDSFTYGSGVRLEDTWPQLLEQALRRGRSEPVEVINAGFAAGSYTTAGYPPWVESDGLAFAPDLVILGFCLNDMGDVPMLGYDVPPMQHVLGSALLGAIVYQWRFRRAQSVHRDMGAIVTADPKPWQESQAALRRLRDLCAAKGVGFVVAVFPMLSQLASGYPYARLHALVREFCAGEHILCVDLQDRFVGRTDEQDLWVHATDQHPNDVGQRLLADGILAFLRQQKLVP